MNIIQTLLLPTPDYLVEKVEGKTWRAVLRGKEVYRGSLYTCWLDINMRKIDEQVEQMIDPITEEEAVKVPHLRLLQGGKGPPTDTPGHNWMSDLKAGSVFSCRKKGQTENYALMMLQINFKHAKTVIISDALNSNPYAAVDPVEFCKRHEFVELIQEGEADNAHDLRTIRSSGMAHDADAEAGQPSDGGSGRE